MTRQLALRVLVDILVAGVIIAVWAAWKRVDRPTPGARSARAGFVVGSHIGSDEQNVVTIRSGRDDVSEMRFGNTRGEMLLTEWEPYAAERLWYLPGFNYKVQHIVHAQYRGPTRGVISLQLPVYSAEADRVPGGGTFPYVPIPDERVSGEIIAHRFDTWNERWVTYQDAWGYGNIFFPMTHQATGGADGGGFVWTDASRWLVDAPETPDSILVGLTYWRWLFPPEWRQRTGLGEAVDLTSATLRVALRGRNLALGPSTVHFWVMSEGRRWHLQRPLDVGDRQWKANQTALPLQASEWRMSWSRDGQPASLRLDRVESYGLAFSGFESGRMPTGVLDVDEVSMTRTAER